MVMSMSKKSEKDYPRALIIFGAPGVGKGTQIKLLEGYLVKNGQEVLSIGTGGLFRDMMENETSTTRDLVADAMMKGDVLPVFLPISLWSQKLREAYQKNAVLIADGFPRRSIEAQVLDTAYDFYGIDTVKVVSIGLDDEEIVTRLMSRGRGDDTREVIMHRLDQYRQETLPVMDYFKENAQRYRITSINGSGTVDEVHEAIITQLGMFQ